LFELLIGSYPYDQNKVQDVLKDKKPISISCFALSLLFSLFSRSDTVFASFQDIINSPFFQEIENVDNRALVQLKSINIDYFFINKRKKFEEFLETLDKINLRETVCVDDILRLDGNIPSIQGRASSVNELVKKFTINV